MSAIADRLARQYPEFDRYWTVNLEPLRDSLIRDVKTSLLVLLGAVALLLAVACANVANLLLARHTARRREIAVRAAIGAGKGRVIRQLLTESLVLGVTGGLLGLAFARAAVSGLTALAPRSLTATAEIAIDLRIVAFAFALSLATGLLFGLAPAVSLFRTDLVTGLREGARGATSHHGLRNALVAAEVALSIVLLAGAGLLFRTLLGLQSTDPGLDPARVLTFRVSIPGAKYRQPVERLQFFTRALGSLRAIPGVASASAINTLPFQGLPSATSISIAGRPPAAAGEMLTSTIRTVMPGYFQTVGIHILQGRDFDMRDNAADAPYRFIVNQTFARRFLAGQDPLAQSVSARMQDKNPYGQIIGVVGDVREGALDREPTPTIYYNQGHMPSTSMVFVLRTPLDPVVLADSARRVIRDLDPAQPVADVIPMDQIIGETYARQRFSATLLTGFSLVALLLAAAGIYGVLAYSVTERTREIGVRMALGADAGRVIGMILASGAKVVAAGSVAGLGAAYLLTRTLKSMLYGVDVHDAATFLTVPAVIAAAALVAAWLPARRAARIAPAQALRAE
jgi:putative ABC transport system permease protein